MPSSLSVTKAFEAIFKAWMAWMWMMVIANIPLVAAASREQQPFPDVPFSLFSKFVGDHFISTVSLSTVLMVLFSVTENTDLFSLHFCQRTKEKSTSATSWIRCLANAVKTRLDEQNSLLLKESDIEVGCPCQRAEVISSQQIRQIQGEAHGCIK